MLTTGPTPLKVEVTVAADAEPAIQTNATIDAVMTLFMESLRAISV